MTARRTACAATLTLLLASCGTSGGVDRGSVTSSTPQAGSNPRTELEQTLAQLLLPEGCVRRANPSTNPDALVALLLPAAATPTTLPCADPISKGR